MKVKAKCTGGSNCLKIGVNTHSLDRRVNVFGKFVTGPNKRLAEKFHHDCWQKQKDLRIHPHV